MVALEKCLALRKCESQQPDPLSYGSRPQLREKVLICRFERKLLIISYLTAFKELIDESFSDVTRKKLQQLINLRDTITF